MSWKVLTEVEWEYLRRMAQSVSDDFLVAIQPDNETIDYSNLNGDSFDVYVLKPECRKMISLLRSIAVIRPRHNNGVDGLEYTEKGWEI